MRSKTKLKSFDVKDYFVIDENNDLNFFCLCH